MKISIVIPVYNELPTLRAALERVISAPYELEVLCVDDGSTDGSGELLVVLQQQHPEIRVLAQPRNHGKGAANDTTSRLHASILMAGRHQEAA